jgi:DNA repair protein RadA/Sms
MAKKNTTIFTCTACGNQQSRWLGRCPGCGSWNTFEESAPPASQPLAFGSSQPGIAVAKPVPLLAVDPMDGRRLLTGIGEFDRVLGGGAMLRSAVLAGGEPGIGKSTLLLQAASSAAARNMKVLYVSGEESAAQIRSRADRLGCASRGIHILCTTRLDDINGALSSVDPAFVVIDSIQTVYSADAGAVPGTVNQLKYCAYDLISWVKEHDAVLFMSAHVTKEGIIAGPKVLEHLVDTVITFEGSNDQVRFLRAQKNRFGSVDELGIFSMTDKGMIPVEDPSAMFITRREGALPAGVASAPVFEGSRVFLVEIQALTVGAKAAITRVFSDKIDSSRVSRVAAVLEKHTGLRFSDQDIYINVAGGVRLTESAIDLALAASLYSARTGVALPALTVFVGELSLAGEVRPVTRVRQRAKTAAALGFLQVFAPPVSPEEKGEGIRPVKDVGELIAAAFASPASRAA